MSDDLYLQINFCRFDIFGCFVRNVFADIARMPPAEMKRIFIENISQLQFHICRFKLQSSSQSFILKSTMLCVKLLIYK